MSKHTPGPWHIDYSTGTTQTYSIVKGDRRIAAVNVRRGSQIGASEAKHNAQLIAAVPKLLAALEAASEIIDDIRHTDWPTRGLGIGLQAEKLDQWLIPTWETIAKAKGEI